MFIRDVMTTNVVTIPSSTSLAEAKRIMDFHHLRRVPVVDKGRLVGIVSRDALDKSGPSKLTTFSIHELSYLLTKITVKEVMVTDLVIVSPDTTVEEAVTLSQGRGVGSALVVEDGRLVGIATTNDFFYKIVNPILGVGKSGSRVYVHKCGHAAEVAKILNTITQLGLDIITMFTIPHPQTGEQDLTLHLNTADPSSVIRELKRLGYEVHERAR
ncbi:MAG: CBS domain-containing protein [Chloroflexi bacterium]|nr:CBS domain-containing protein [Chloroflexota bacterium]